MQKQDYKGIWIYAEHRNGKLDAVVYELLGKAQELKDFCKEEITAVLLGNNVSALSDELIACGADRVIIAEDPALAEYSARPYQKALTQLVNKYNPSMLIYGATTQGRDLAPRMMVSLKTGLTADAIDLGFDEDGDFCQTTPGYGGKILAHIVIPERRPQMVTVHPHSFAPAQPDASRTGSVINETVEVEADESVKLLSVEERSAAGTPIDQAHVLVSGGRAVKTEADLAMLRELADLLGGELAGSRPLIDSGLLPHEAQIGQSGKSVAPELLINVGLSGSVQYRVGMKSAKRIMSINTAASAPVFDISGYGAVADYRSLVPTLIKEIKKRRGTD